MLWCGYYAAVLVERDERNPGKFLFERKIVLPANSSVPPLLRDARTLRGLGLDLKKVGGKKDWELLSTVQSDARIPLPQDFPVEHVLFRLWGVRPPEHRQPPKGAAPDMQDYDSQEEWERAMIDYEHARAPDDAFES